MGCQAHQRPHAYLQRAAFGNTARKDQAIYHVSEDPFFISPVTNNSPPCVIILEYLKLPIR